MLKLILLRQIKLDFILFWLGASPIPAIALRCCKADRNCIIQSAIVRFNLDSSIVRCDRILDAIASSSLPKSDRAIPPLIFPIAEAGRWYPRGYFLKY
ncbi:hypothetical protein [Limnofasciculus baicalensis]|uniref:Uncharacterized protein n=1 Tax=Limnofasciculus baicalensis BBK-W-15 TaxID=2699891 RepID=A0AAE3GP57_9CYAN|nr:hypothetical protein [Limnofasciculus baicalensis]MCP2727497.1 hypothetical protein [Limnofasciculus baicalensis BBK-W-15]